MSILYTISQAKYVVRTTYLIFYNRNMHLILPRITEGTKKLPHRHLSDIREAAPVYFAPPGHCFYYVVLLSVIRHDSCGHRNSCNCRNRHDTYDHLFHIDSSVSAGALIPLPVNCFFQYSNIFCCASVQNEHIVLQITEPISQMIPNDIELSCTCRTALRNQFILQSSQKATALAAATFSESTPCFIGIITV